MRKALNVALVLGGILISVMASPSKPVTTNGSSRDVVEPEGLPVAQPTGMKNIPAALVPLP
jgi:hypothetical protein